jgi:hypothetical protein
MYVRSSSVSKVGLGWGEVASERDIGERKPYEVDMSLPTDRTISPFCDPLPGNEKIWRFRSGLPNFKMAAF